MVIRMGKILKAIQAIWIVLALNAIAGATADLLLPTTSTPTTRQLLETVKDLSIMKQFGIIGNIMFIEFFFGMLGLTIAFLARRIEAEEL